MNDSTLDQYGLKPETIRKVCSIFREYPQIEKVLLCGSRALGTFKPGSDIDLSMVAPSLGLTELLKIENQIDDLLLPYKVDLSLFHKLDNADLVDHISRVGQVLYDSTKARPI